MKYVEVKGSEVIGTRTFDVSPETVWNAWTDPKIISLWWGPRGFSTTTETMEMKPDGVWKFTMHGPDGRDYKNKIIYIEVSKPTRLVYRHAGDEETEPVSFQVTVTFDKVGGKTKMTMRMMFDSAVELERVQKEYGAIEGLEQTLERLSEYIVKL
jgi:uncharacterized protein YndB with AHSA1/START domain